MTVVPGILQEIQDTVEAYARIMAKVAQVEVDVADDRLFRIANLRGACE